MGKNHLVLPAAAIATALLVTGCGTEVGESIQTPLIAGATTSATETEEAVPDRPRVDWDAPVVNGVEVTAEDAMEVAGVDFDVVVPALHNGTLLKILATDPEWYPEGLRGYGVLYDVAADEGATLRLLVEETPVGVGEGELIRDMASNGPGFDLELVDGVEVVFIHPEERASALLLLDGIKFNVHGPALTMPVVRDAVTAIIAQRQ